MTFYLREGMTVEDFLAASCLKKSLNPVEHFVRVKKRRSAGGDHVPSSQKYFVPHRADLIETYVSSSVRDWRQSLGCCTADLQTKISCTTI